MFGQQMHRPGVEAEGERVSREKTNVGRSYASSRVYSTC
jgi:hypothetical protein